MKVTMQEVFNKAWKHFVVNGKPPGISTRGGCAYLNRVTGNKCAIGLSIPDGHEAQDSPSYASILAAKYPELFDVPEDFNLSSFQRKLHDELIDFDRGTWIRGLDLAKSYRNVAEQFNLTVPE